MTGVEYTLEQISYSRKEDRRIMESVLRNWLYDPKALNFFHRSQNTHSILKSGCKCIIRKTI